MKNTDAHTCMCTQKSVLRKNVKNLNNQILVDFGYERFCYSEGRFE
jgi:hypothetical protein